MTLEQFFAMLAANPRAALQLVLPDRSFVPAHFHVTEIGRVQKDFMDCGGTIRNSLSCVLQVLVANDVDHRLDTTKLLTILQQGKKLFDATDIPVEVEYENVVVSQYPLQHVEATDAGLTLHLGTKHTACLAPDRCGIGLDVLQSCSTPGCC